MSSQVCSQLPAGVGCIRDSRPLADKSYQQSQVKKILDFLKRKNYKNVALTSRHFPLSAKEFVNIFNFLYYFLQPQSSSVVPLEKFEEKVISIFMSLSYPGSLNKSTFRSLDSAQSWPTVLGSLSFLCDLAIIYTEKVLPNIKTIGFPTMDDHGRLIHAHPYDEYPIYPCSTYDDYHTFSYFMDCFEEFNTGATDYPIQNIDYEDKLMKNRGLKLTNLNILQEKEVKLRTQFSGIEDTSSQKNVLLTKCDNMEGDVKKLLDYNGEMESHLNKLTNVSDLQLRMEQDLIRKEKKLDEEIEELWETCKSRKVLQLEDVSFVKVVDCKIHLEQAQNNAKDAEKEIFEQEIKVSIQLEELEGIVKKFNSLSFEMGVGGEDPLILSVPVFKEGEIVEENNYDRHWQELPKLLKIRRAATKNMEKEFQAEVYKTEQLKDIFRRNMREEEQKSNDVKKLENYLGNIKEINFVTENGQLESHLDSRVKSVMGQTDGVVNILKNTMEALNLKVEAVLKDVEKTLIDK